MSKKSDAEFNKAIARLQREGGLALSHVFAEYLKDHHEMPVPVATATVVGDGPLTAEVPSSFADLFRS